jgi:ABC-type phosphate transport system substrate-binding protein
MRFAAALCFLALLLPAATGGSDSRIAVIVHRDRRDALDVTAVASIYLRKRRFWADGAPIVPINREADSGLRERFTRRVFATASGQLSAYWNRQYFHGILPPATLSSTPSMKRFVSEEPNAIGYVEADAVDSSVRVALMLD